eukprot:TRINITY_DN935_c0_g1_i1.p2 TRINITY_DN935_c0_g1~~TRINITY_DN935_c0_g1_i1.p2  ORF type:complete len:414 (-),score=119.67 TRINITY_DN935_c0_g1_i1:84-1325(-)
MKGSTRLVLVLGALVVLGWFACLAILVQRPAVPPPAATTCAQGRECDCPACQQCPEVPQMEQQQLTQKQQQAVVAATGTTVIIPVIVIACARPQYLERALDSLLQQRPTDGDTRFPIFVSQDCNKAEVTELLTGKYANQVIRLIHTHPPNEQPRGDNYELIADHYKWALHQVFTAMRYDAVIIVEDDMEVSPDFFSYFRAGFDVLRNDKTIWCVSSWNDNGLDSLVDDPLRLYRSDFFPGLGWMMLGTLWDELAPQWPPGYWDEFMRKPSVRQGRACVRPEVSRTLNFGEQGVSMGQFYNSHLQYIHKNTKKIDWSAQDLSYLRKDNYDAALDALVGSATLLQHPSDASNYRGAVLRFNYASPSDYESLAHEFTLMSDFKEGIPRTSYNGVVTFKWHGNTVVIVSDKQYRRRG